MESSEFLDLALSVIAGVMGMLLLLRLGLVYKALRMYWGGPHGATSNASHLGLAPPAEAGPMMADLSDLGFHRLGETQVQTPGAEEPLTCWLFGDPGGVAFAELAGPLPLVGLTTMFQDETVVQTLYPVGEKVNAPDYVCRAVSGSLESAHEHHLRQVQELSAQHGQPRLVEDMRHYLDVAAIYRARHGRRLDRAFLRRQFAALLVNLYGLATPVGGMVVRRSTDVAPALILIGVLVLALAPFFVKRDGFPDLSNK